MSQTPEGSEADLLRAARSRLIKAERARQNLSQDATLALVNDQLLRAGHRQITRGHLANIELCRRELSEPVLRAIAAALGIPEAKIRHPLADLWADKAVA